MKIFRRLFFILAVVFFFLLGISAADKEYLSDSVVGICIMTEDQTLSAQVCDLIERSCCTDIQEVQQFLENSEFDLEISRSKRYFDADLFEMGQIPDGVYDTIVIDPGENCCSEMVFLKQLSPMSYRFDKMNVPVASAVQKYYISFLSVIGRAEKFALDLAKRF